jgi:hypothetical protein
MADEQQTKEIKQKAIEKAVCHSRKVISDMGHVTANDEVISWMADQIDDLKSKINRIEQANAVMAYGAFTE